VEIKSNQIAAFFYIRHGPYRKSRFERFVATSVFIKSSNNREIPRHADSREGFMEYAAEMDSGFITDG
jgi:hypothetical protein